MIETLLATSETDRENRYKYMQMGMQDRMNGKKPRFSPENGLMYKWYMEGYNQIAVE